MEKGDRLYEVVIDFAPRAAPFIREREWHSSQRIDEHPDGSLTLHLEVGGLQEVKRWVLGYGKEAIAISTPGQITRFGGLSLGESWAMVNGIRPYRPEDGDIRFLV